MPWIRHYEKAEAVYDKFYEFYLEAERNGRRLELHLVKKM